MIKDLAACLEARTQPPPAFVVQLNKRDLETAMPVQDLKQALEIPPELPVFEASAVVGIGVIETLNPLCQAVMQPFQASTNQETDLKNNAI
jgi:signal recognition particle receptor subunit beta